MARNKRRTRVVHVDAARQDGQPLQARDVDADPAGSAAAVEADLDAHAARTDNPHAVTKAQVGLGSVPNLDTTAAVALAHPQQHAIDDPADHTGAAGDEDNLVALDANGLPKDAGTDVATLERMIALRG